jgi:ubiquinone/menaquinone biosynthesis C-methylase UbiE
MKNNNFTIEQVKNFWDTVATQYDLLNNNFKETHHQRFNVGINLLNLKDNLKILNIWSRTGCALPYLRDGRSIEVVNLEVSPAMIELAKKKFPKEVFFQTDLKKIQFPDNYYDRILSLETLEHAPDPIVLLMEFKRIIKPEGIIVMSLPPHTAELPLYLYEKFFKNHGEGPHRFISSSEVKKMIHTAGLKLLGHKSTLLIPVGPIWLQKIGEKIIEKFQHTLIGELGIRQFYICTK